MQFVMCPILWPITKHIKLNRCLRDLDEIRHKTDASMIDIVFGAIFMTLHSTLTSVFDVVIVVLCRLRRGDMRECPGTAAADGLSSPGTATRSQAQPSTRWIATLKHQPTNVSLYVEQRSDLSDGPEQHCLSGIQIKLFVLRIKSNSCKEFGWENN